MSPEGEKERGRCELEDEESVRLGALSLRPRCLALSPAVERPPSRPELPLRGAPPHLEEEERDPRSLELGLHLAEAAEHEAELARARVEVGGDLREMV